MADQEKTVNGINVTRLFSTVDTIKKDPGIAKFRFRATNRWVNGTHNQASVKDFFGAGQDFAHAEPYVFDEDEPDVLLGKDAGANPVEYVLVALSGCLTTSLVAHAAARGVKLDAVESKLEGDLDVRGFLGMTEEVRRGYDNIRVTFRIKSDAPREKLQELVELAQKRSPVFDIVTNPTPVKVTLES
ncbi:OsmC family protein [Methanocella sp. MCL-LM]|uniref:OsmC family protein n=1 Tax=Methanocella sp. MCL-LM TaxID=3412035 RepID=UPI003C7608A9